MSEQLTQEQADKIIAVLGECDDSYYYPWILERLNKEFPEFVWERNERAGLASPEFVAKPR